MALHTLTTRLSINVITYHHASFSPLLNEILVYQLCLCLRIIQCSMATCLLDERILSVNSQQCLMQSNE